MFDYPKLAHKRYRKKSDRFRHVILELITNQRQNAESEKISLIDSQEKVGQSFDLKRESNRLVKKLATQKVFQFLSTRDQKIAEIHGKLPQGWIVAFKVPPFVGGAYSRENLCITTPDVNELMQELYWKQVSIERQAAIYMGRQIDVVMPKIPTVFSLKDFLDIIPGQERQSLENYLSKKEKWRKDALKSVRITKSKNRLILRLTKSMAVPVGFRKALVKAKQLVNLEREQVKAEYLASKEDLVHQAFKRGDFDHLPRMIKGHILATGRVPAAANLTCHHVIPRAIGGSNTVDNIIFLGPTEHLQLHQKYINPLMVYFDSLISEKRPIYFEIPVPEEGVSLPTYVETKKGTVVRESLLKEMSKTEKTKQKIKGSLRHKFIRPTNRQKNR